MSSPATSSVASSPPIEIYTKWGCGYCYRAKALLDAKGVAYEEFDTTMGGPPRAQMLQRAPGSRTVPQIFIGGVHVARADRQAGHDAGSVNPEC